MSSLFRFRQVSLGRIWFPIRKQGLLCSPFGILSPYVNHEIRDTVLSSATTEQRARNTALEEENDALDYVIQNKPAFLIQAVPILPLKAHGRFGAEY